MVLASSHELFILGRMVPALTGELPCASFDSHTGVVRVLDVDLPHVGCVFSTEHKRLRVFDLTVIDAHTQMACSLHL